MTRGEFIKWLVLNEVCDDFENMDQVILRRVAETGARCGLTVDRWEVVQALAELVDRGLVKAYDLRGVSDPFAGEIEGMPAVDTVEEDFRTYFYVTPEGRKLRESDDSWWPLDDEGELRLTWRLEA
jgi:hypothetical protein